MISSPLSIRRRHATVALLYRGGTFILPWIGYKTSRPTLYAKTTTVLPMCSTVHFRLMTTPRGTYSILLFFACLPENLCSMFTEQFFEGNGFMVPRFFKRAHLQEVANMTDPSGRATFLSPPTGVVTENLRRFDRLLTKC